ncbi:MAG: hypothetical protein HY908_11150 [Myxococcales bacterium]|nr:hypothetical protein [Myxococcales bacterium]
MMQQSLLSGPEKAVLFLLSLDEQVATPIVNELSVQELCKLREAAATMRQVSADAIDQTFRDYLERSSEAVAVPRGGLSYLHRLAKAALGPSAAEVFEAGAPVSPLSRLEAAPPDAVGALLEREPPQLVGAVLARLEPSVSAAILATMPPEREAEILARIVRIADVPAGLLEQVATALADELPANEKETFVGLDGVARVAEILNATPKEQATTVLERLEARDADAARDVRMAMYTFRDLQRLDARDMRTLLREVPTDKLTLALKDAPEDVAAAMYGGLSTRAAELIRDDLELLGRVRKNDIEAARREVVETALRLEAEGTISLARPDE